MSAYVEVCFDNSQDRFNTGKPEFHLRRTIGQKKDEYSLDRKNATKTEVQQVLESAGLSRSNPYYIVPQGRVTALTNMKDPERLSLLKEISGSNVYETRRTDSLRLLTDTDNKRSKIDDLVEELEKRLSELEGDKQALQDYNKKDRERRCLLYVINRQEELQYEEKISEIDSRRQNGMADTDNNRQLFIQNEKDMAQIDSEISQLRSQIDLLKDDRVQLEADRRDAARTKAKVELEYKELTDGQSAAQKAKKRHDTDLKNVQQQIKVREDELKRLLPRYDSKKAEENNIRAQLAEAEGQRKRLEDKQGRTAYYTNKRQRDDALRKEINQVNMDLATRKAVLMDTNEEVVNLQNEIGQLEKEIEDQRAAIENEGDSSLNFATRVQKARDARDSLQDQKKELWREDARLSSHLSNAEQQLTSAERTLSHLMDHNTSRGLQTLRRLQSKHGLDGVYGTIADLMQVSPHYKTAAEVTAGSSLFHLVCDNDATATKVVELLNKEKGGRLTCIPLNRVRRKNTQLPKATDAQPLISKITYDDAYENAFQHVFGNTIICPDLNIATGYARTHGVNALTPDGDQAFKKGNLRGGWVNPAKSQLDAVHEVNRLREEVETQRGRKSEIRKELEKLEQQVTAALSQLRKIEHEKDRAENSYGPMRQELRAKQGLLQTQRDVLEQKQQTAATLDSRINELGDRQSDLEAELASDFKKALSKDEERTLATLASTVQDLRRQLSNLTTERSELESRKNELEVELRENLQPKLDQLQSQESGSSGTGNQPAKLKECERSLKKVDATLEDYDEKIATAESEIEQLNTQLTELESSKTEKEQNNREIARSIEKHQRRMDRSMQDRAQAQEDLARAQKEIRDLGTLPDEAWSTYGKMKPEKVRMRLETIIVVLVTDYTTGKRAPQEGQ
jgi:structural maintenance of chromosome 3 (chondroitin sulfate proteoglycan 6)